LEITIVRNETTRIKLVISEAHKSDKPVVAEKNYRKPENTRQTNNKTNGYTRYILTSISPIIYTECHKKLCLPFRENFGNYFDVYRRLDFAFFFSESQTIEDFGAALHLMRSDLEHLRSVFMAVENGDLGMLKSLGIKDSELGDVKFFLEKLVNTGFLD
jgi:hypothetical protein